MESSGVLPDGDSTPPFTFTDLHIFIARTFTTGLRNFTDLMGTVMGCLEEEAVADVADL
jgi:hypothetical protein